MSNVCGKSFFDKISHVFNKQKKTIDLKCCTVNTFTADCKCLNSYNNTDGKHKIKRLRSRKERSQMRSRGKEAPTSKSHHPFCCHHSSRDRAHSHNCCHGICHCPSRRVSPFSNVVPSTQESSVITDSRLIGHHGLFNHEVKSIDIERLLSKRKKLDKRGQEKPNAASHPSPTCHISSPLCSNDQLAADSDEIMPFEKKVDPAAKGSPDCSEKEKKISQLSDVTPGQRPQQQLHPSSGSLNSILSYKHSSPSIEIIKSKKPTSVMSESNREDRKAQLTPTINKQNAKTLNRKVKGHNISAPKSLVHQTQMHRLSQSPLELSSSHTADNFDIQNRRQAPDGVSKTISAIAARLCDSLQLPLQRRRNLLEESREVLLNALQERHGPQLQENLLKVQQCVSFGTDPAKEVKEQESVVIDEDELWPTGSRHFFNWRSTPQLHQDIKQNGRWLASPKESSVSFLDNILRPTCCPQSCMDFEPSAVTASDHSFIPSPTPCQREKASAIQPWEDSFKRPKSKEAVKFDSLENSFMTHTRTVTERSSGSLYSDNNTQLFYQGQLPNRRSVQRMHFPQELDPFQTDRYPVAPSIFPQQNNPFQPHSPFSHPLAFPGFRSHHTDMMDYPPSHLLETDTATLLSSFPSPEHWSFPPMRLY